jgi:HAMP domain-containing protein
MKTRMQGLIGLSLALILIGIVLLFAWRRTVRRLIRVSAQQPVRS